MEIPPGVPDHIRTGHALSSQWPGHGSGVEAELPLPYFLLMCVIPALTSFRVRLGNPSNKANTVQDPVAWRKGVCVAFTEGTMW